LLLSGIRALTDYADTTLTGPIDMDEGRFTNVTFVDAQLRYAGGTPPVFIECSFTRSRFVFSGPAKNMLQFLRSMTNEKTNMAGIVRGLLPGLNPSPPARMRPTQVTYRPPTIKVPGTKPER
jgi:hypothetical protein